jgi:hypothetical protein
VYGAVRFYCHAPSAAGQFTIPPSILLALPAGSGYVSVTNATAPQTVTATGLDVGLATASAVFRINTIFR